MKTNAQLVTKTWLGASVILEKIADLALCLKLGLLTLNKEDKTQLANLKKSMIKILKIKDLMMILLNLEFKELWALVGTEQKLIICQSILH